MINPKCVESDCSADNSMHLMPLGNERNGQVGSVLAGDSSDEFFWGHKGEGMKKLLRCNNDSLNEKIG